jgi:hypothetical protein
LGIGLGILHPGRQKSIRPIFARLSKILSPDFRQIFARFSSVQVLAPERRAAGRHTAAILSFSLKTRVPF